MVANYTALFTCKLVTYFRMAFGSGGVTYQLSDPKMSISSHAILQLAYPNSKQTSMYSK
jgi:hypothetical protein